MYKLKKIGEKMINLKKIKEEMIQKNEFFYLKKGSELMVIPELDIEDTLDIEPVMITTKRDVLFHPNGLIGINICEECECEPSYNFQHPSPNIRQFVVNESDVVRVSGGV